jgi:hypothetical protein
MEIAGSFSLGKVAPVHDVDIEYRSTLKNVDPSLTKNNIVYIDELQGRTIEQYTNDEMQPFIDEYDAKQKRKDRKIMSKYENYIDWHMSDKKMMKGIKEGEQPEWAYEFVMQYGNHEDYWHEYFDPNTSESRKKEMHDQADNEFKELIKEFKERYPHAHIALAAAHFDEPAGSGHLHLIVQFRPDQYERSLKTRVGVSRALEQDGFKYIQSTSEAKEIEGFQMERLFKDFRHNVMNERIKAMGFDIKKEEKGAKHYDCPTYQKIMQQAAQTLEAAERIREEAHEKAVKELSFAETASKIKDKAEKIIEEKGTEVIIDRNYKDSVFSKPRAVAIVPLEIYESRSAAHNIKGAVQHLDLQFDRMEKIANKTMEEIESDGKAAAEREIQELKQEVGKLKEEIKKKDNIIQYLTQKIDHMIEFIHQHNLLAMWQRLWRSIEDRSKKRDQEIEIKEREY